MCDVKPMPDGFTIWDKVIVDQGEITVKQLIDVNFLLYNRNVAAFTYNPPRMQTKFPY